MKIVFIDDENIHIVMNAMYWPTAHLLGMLLLIWTRVLLSSVQFELNLKSVLRWWGAYVRCKGGVVYYRVWVHCSIMAHKHATKNSKKNKKKKNKFQQFLYCESVFIWYAVVIVFNSCCRCCSCFWGCNFVRRKHSYISPEQ